MSVFPLHIRSVVNYPSNWRRKWGRFERVLWDFAGSGKTVRFRVWVPTLNHHSPTHTSLHLRHSAFSNPSTALPTSQLVLQLFRCFTCVIDISPTSQLILQSFRRFIYVTAHSTTLPLLHLRHSSFSNPPAASPTSQVILKPFHCFTYVTGTSRTSPGEPPMHRGMKKQSVVD